MSNILDSEVAQLHEVWKALTARTYKSHNLQQFHDEIVERYADIGWKAKVNWFETDAQGTYIPEIEIVDRHVKEEFDHEKMRHEVVNNFLDLPTQEAGIIKTDGTWTAPAHTHGSSCE